ncbi:hypothetical protein AMELA_G00082860 [Ameiurus melas]|uniref:Stereocilin LRR domain-containing protein n=1 Tax=Ameiurus melas TaxID=219545 RepID=A0A7J6B0N3_AMEME|nr:hypothetical protein AMELA_G00082860 [Ameiurus melas]
MSFARGTLICLLLAHWATVISQGMLPPGFPPLPQDFKEMAKKMMTICSMKGYSPPILKDSMLNSSFFIPNEMTVGNPISIFASLLSSLPPLSSPIAKPNETDLALNITEKMCNSSNLPQMIDHLWNTTEKTHCFMRAFLAPLSWVAIVQNATQFDPEQLRKMLWVAKPFLEMSNYSLMLPPTLQGSQLPLMMQTFNEVFVSLSEGQRNDIRRWMKARVTENDPSCAPNNSLTGVPSPPMPVQHSMLNSSISGCQPKIPWLKAEVLRMMGRFISRLPEADLRGILPEELCKFFQSPEFQFSFSNVSGMQTANAQTLMQRLKQECFNATQNFPNQMDRLGYLVCFYDDPQSLNATLIKKLLHQLGGCEPSGIDEMRKQLVRKLLSDGEPPTSEMLHSLGSGMSVLSPSILSSFSRDSLNNAMFSLSQTEWKPAQAKILVQKLLEKAKDISGEKLLSLGSMVRGVDSDLLKNVKAQGLLGSEGLKNISEKLSSLQKKALLVGMHADVNASHLVKEVPDALIASLSLSILDKANLNSLDQLEGHSWSRTQGKNASAVSAADISSLGPLVCELDPTWISSLKPDAINFTVQALASCKHIPQPYRAPLFTLLTNFYGAPSNWSEDVTKSLGPLVLLNDAALEALSFKSWLKKSLSDLQHSMEAEVAGLAPEEFRAWPDFSALQRKLFQLKTKITQQRRKRDTLVPTLPMIEDLREGNVLWSPAQLSSMTAQTYRDGASILGEIRGYTSEQVMALRDKAIEAWGDVAMLNESKIVEMGCVSQSFNAKQLQNLSITSLDTLELLSICQWNQTQKEAVLRGFLTRTGMKLTKLGALEMAGLGQFICGLQPNETEQLNATEFKDAVGDVGHASCPLSVLECLKKKAVAAFGDPKGWGEADVSVMGNIIAGLTANELGYLNASVLPFIRQSAISLIPPERLAALSVSQLKALGPDNAAAITTSQRAALGVEQRAAVDEAVGLATQKSEITTPLPQKGGASKQSMLGTAVLLQPLALLLLGYIR